MKRVLTALIILMLALTAREAIADEELERTWNAAWVYVPDPGPAGYRKIDTAGLPTYLASAAAAPLAAILYAHGCDGLGDISSSTARFLAQAGYMLVAPDSFARKDKPASCEPAGHLAGLHRGVLGWRQAEINFAFDRLSHMQGATHLPIVLMGHSEGAITTATIGDLPVAGRIIEGWTCHAGWPEYRGLNAPKGQPVLALVGENDPWFKDPVLKGDCGAFMQEPSARSIVYRAPNYLNGKHWLSSDTDVQHEILSFLQTIRKTDGK